MGNQSFTDDKIELLAKSHTELLYIIGTLTFLTAFFQVFIILNIFLNLQVFLGSHLFNSSRIYILLSFAKFN